MHPRSPYFHNPPLFSKLAKQFPSLAPYLRNNGKSIDFKDPNAVRELTRALLLVDFQLNVKLPEDRLCPMVPNRLNYVLLLQDLIDTTTRDSWKPDLEAPIRGLDIGTGASCIYPLLAVRSRRKWTFVAAELDEESRLYAVRNVTDNELDSQIVVIAPTVSPETKKASVLPMPHAIPPNPSGSFLFDFTMTNPPFYSSESDLHTSNTQKKLPPNSACTGAPIEMIYSDGGEAGFIGEILAASLKYEGYSRWFTSLCGKKETVDQAVALFKEKKIANYFVKRLETGEGGTFRWVVGWSKEERRPPVWMVRGRGIRKEWIPETGFLRFGVAGDAGEVKANLQSLIGGLQHVVTSWPQDEGGLVMWGWTPGDCWSRKYRRAMKKDGADYTPIWPDGGGMGFRIAIGDEETAEQEAEGPQQEGIEEHETENMEVIAVGKVPVSIYWTRGFDRVLFESFTVRYEF